MKHVDVTAELWWALAAEKARFPLIISILSPQHMFCRDMLKLCSWSVLCALCIGATGDKTGTVGTQKYGAVGVRVFWLFTVSDQQSSASQMWSITVLCDVVKLRGNAAVQEDGDIWQTLAVDVTTSPVTVCWKYNWSLCDCSVSLPLSVHCCCVYNISATDFSDNCVFSSSYSCASLNSPSNFCTTSSSTAQNQSMPLELTGHWRFVLVSCARLIRSHSAVKCWVHVKLFYRIVSYQPPQTNSVVCWQFLLKCYLSMIHNQVFIGMLFIQELNIKIAEKQHKAIHGVLYKYHAKCQLLINTAKTSFRDHLVKWTTYDFLLTFRSNSDY